MKTNYVLLSAVLAWCTAGSWFAQPADAAGCLKGAAVGALAGHVAGHHAALGAAAGCAVGHHEATKSAKEKTQLQNTTDAGQANSNPGR